VYHTRGEGALALLRPDAASFPDQRLLSIMCAKLCA